MTWSRQDYIDTAVARGHPRARAEALADGLMRAHERAAAGAPGWERLCLEAPMDVIVRYRDLYVTSVETNPSPSPRGQIESGLAAVFGYGLIVGMLLAERGFGPSEVERAMAAQNTPEVDAWIEALREAGR